MKAVFPFYLLVTKFFHIGERKVYLTFKNHFSFYSSGCACGFDLNLYKIDQVSHVEPHFSNDNFGRDETANFWISIRTSLYLKIVMASMRWSSTHFNDFYFALLFSHIILHLSKLSIPG